MPGPDCAISMNNTKSVFAIAACAALTTVLGSIHAFSVFIPQWENIDGANRASVSLIYSISLVLLTLTVLLGYRLYARVSPAVVFLLSGCGAAAGLYLASSSTSLMLLYFSYGVLFGGANGIGYGFALQLAGQSASNRRGLAMSVVTAFYAVGATLSPLIILPLLKQGGNSLALVVMSGLILAVSLLCALVLVATKAGFHSEKTADIQPLSKSQQTMRRRLWLAYGCAVLSGLMAIGHAFSLAEWLRVDERWTGAAPVLVAVGNMLGGFFAGAVADRLSSRALCCWLPLLSALGLFLLFGPGTSTWPIGLAGLALVGFSYGALIAAYPVTVSDIFGDRAAARIYGQVFTAWGLAGLAGPWLSGWLFDVQSTYSLALIMAMLLSIGSTVIVRYWLPD